MLCHTAISAIAADSARTALKASFGSATSSSSSPSCVLGMTTETVGASWMFLGTALAFNTTRGEEREEQTSRTEAIDLLGVSL